jgi:hypothetical protein
MWKGCVYIVIKWIVNGKMKSAICTFSLSGYALDPSLDNHQVSAKYIGSVEEAEKNQGNVFEIILPNIYVCFIISVLQ